MTNRNKIIILVLCLVVLAFVLSPYRNSLGRITPYLLLLLCPLMHIFMMRSHGRHPSEHHGDNHQMKK